jgi:CRP/FNR family transcriptional regulator
MPLFFDLTEQQQEAVALNSQCITLEKKSNLDFNGYDGKYMYVVISGKMKICEINPLGEEIVKEFIKDGDLLGEVGNHTKFHFNYEFAKVISHRVLMYKIPKTVIKELMAENPAFSIEITATMLDRYKKMEARYRNFAYINCVKKRLLMFFRDIATQEGTRNGNTVIFSNYMTHQDIANLVFSTRVTVNKILNDLKQEGLLDYSRRTFEIRDINYFSQVAA